MSAAAHGHGVPVPVRCRIEALHSRVTIHSLAGEGYVSEASKQIHTGMPFPDGTGVACGVRLALPAEGHEQRLAATDSIILAQ